ncbi:MAG TPA: hypothetical protein VKG67_06250, partial [Gallionellaceae bacterium]|nr:hypothetical protein [Gallionellaceae bacterium]
VIIIDDGKVLRDGTLDELLNDGVAQVRLAVEGEMATQLSMLLGRFGTVESIGEEWRVMLAPGHTPTALLAAVEEAGGQLRHAEFGRNNLEQLFMTLTLRSLRD